MILYIFYLLLSHAYYSLSPGMATTTIMEAVFGHMEEAGENKTVKIYTLENSRGVRAEIISFGASLKSLVIPDSKGNFEDVILGFDDLPGYLGERGRNPYFGATVGRVANRIAKGKFQVDGVEYSLATNNGENHLHGGIRGFGKVNWEGLAHQDGRVTFTYNSPHMDEGYPGIVMAQVTYELTEENELVIDFKAMTSLPTPVNLCNHAYFNLAGQSAGSEGLYSHVVQLNADFYTPVDSALIPTGEIRKVDESVFDLRKATRLQDVVNQVEGGGYDHNFVVNSKVHKQFKNIEKPLSSAGKFWHAGSGRTMEVFTDQPGFQFYTGNFLSADNPLLGKNNSVYPKHGGFCVETQNYPDAINQPSFPNPVLRPGEVYQRTAVYKFSVSQ